MSLLVRGPYLHELVPENPQHEQVPMPGDDVIARLMAEKTHLQELKAQKQKALKKAKRRRKSLAKTSGFYPAR